MSKACARSRGSLRGTQTRLMLGAWLGVEDALDGAAARGERDRVKDDVPEWPPFSVRR
jgi:phosphoenolpyruvate carboxylase